MVVPIFRIFDIEKAEWFYIHYLGFKLDWSHQFEEGMPVYRQISLNDCLIHLTEHHGDCSPGGAIRIKVSNLKEYHAALKEKDYPYARPNLEKTPWNTIEVTVRDPFYNRITFYEELEG
ncbi:glyoxalase superfamily protein [Bacillus carboniphilus]|uniref:Bleomycin resistance protein n=1 Tax=Bacillus carboniphilus TaxID=86663 RepID=A0ABN0WJJ2_9BACI